MGQAPLPPHERPWRHPSELAAAEREAFRTASVPASTRVFAVVTGTMGLLAVGVLILSATPRRQESPVAISATTTPVATAQAAAAALRPGGIAAIGRFASDDEADATPEAVPPALATTIGDGRTALMTRLSTGGAEGDAFDVRLASGPVVTAAVIDTTDEGLVVVTIAEADDSGHDVAGALPGADEMVTILADPPVTVLFSEIASVGADEGTPVVDADGQLIGLCTRSGDGEHGVVDVTGQGEPAADDTTPATSAPATTASSPVTDASVAATTAAP